MPDIPIAQSQAYKKILATGDDFSLVKLFKYPCVVEKAGYREFKGHSSHVPKPV